jgi:hypothetical protein
VPLATAIGDARRVGCEHCFELFLVLVDLTPPFEGLTQVATVTETVTEETSMDGEAQKLLKKVVSRLGLEPRALALKARPLLRKINTMTLLNRPMSDKHSQRVTLCVYTHGNRCDL